MRVPYDFQAVPPLAVNGSPVVSSTAAEAAAAMEYLPFTVRIVSTAVDLQKAIQVRHDAYARHIDPKFADALRNPEPMDTAPGVVVLLAESKLDGSPLGSMRIQTNQGQALCVEQSIDLPTWMQGKKLAEATRLGVALGAEGRLVKTVLVKAGYLFCVRNGIDYMVVTARAPLDRQYERLLFKDIYPGMGFVPLSHVFNLPHRIMCFDVFGGEKLWNDERHPLLGFMRYTEHPDVEVGTVRM